LPAGPAWQIQSQSNAGLCSISAGTLSCGPTSLASAGGLHVHITAATPAQQCASYHNTATVSTSNDGAGEASAQIVCNQASIHISKTADASPVNAGDPIFFSVTLTTPGPTPFPYTTLFRSLPAGPAWQIQSQSNAGLCSISAGTLSCGP